MGEPTSAGQDAGRHASAGPAVLRSTVSAAAIAERLGLHPPTPQQRRVIEAPLGPALVVAGAGSGKTETMAMRVLWLLANERVHPAEILGLTFTRKAASELAERVRDRLRMLAAAGLAAGYDPFDPPVVSTYNAFANGLYRDHAVRIGRDADGVVLGEASAWQLARRTVVESDDPELANLDLQVDSITQLVLDIANGLGEHAADADAVVAMAGELRTAVELLPYGASAYQGDVDSALLPARTLPVLIRLAQTFRAVKRAIGAVQYSDQVALALDITAAAPDVVQALRDRHRVVLLDEYQDTSVVQTGLLARLFAGGAVMAVGDPHQSIYGWRGASAANLDGFARDFAAGREVSVHALSTSWRNGTAILAAANAIAAPLTAASRVPVERLDPSPVASRHAVDTVYPETLAAEADAVAAWFGAKLDLGAGATPPSAALLVRARRTLPEFLAAFRRAGVPYHVLGVGGLLLEPEVTDLVAGLRVVHDAQAGAELVRLLAGGRWRIGPADLAALQALARWLEHHDAAEQRLPPEVAAAFDRSLAEGESASVVDALDFLARRPGHGAIRGFTDVGRERLADAGRLFAGLRAASSGDLPGFVHRVIETLGLDIEVAANERRSGPAPLEAFDEALAGYLAVAGGATLGGFLGWLRAAEQKEDLSPRTEPPERGTVQVLTVHGSKGLEWDLVAVPRLVNDELPSKPKSSKGWLSAGVLPYAFRGDAAELPVLGWRGFADRKALKEGIAAFKEAVKAMQLAEERRLAYVAVTRARHHLLLSGSFWGGQKAARDASPFLLDIAAAGVIPDPPAGSRFTDPPEGAPVETMLWPTDPLGGRRPAVEEAAAEVAAATGDGGRWADRIRVLLAERARRAAGVRTAIPDRIPASRFKDFVDDLDAVMYQVRRPMPEQPYRATRLGTVFHAWVEQRAGVPATEELVDAGRSERDEAIERDDDVPGIEALQATFAASEWGALEPLEVETEIQVPFEGRILVCKIDAVYRRGDRIEIVDWKTGRPPTTAADADLKQFQLALYRFAYAQREGMDPESIDAAFYYVAADLVVRPERVYSEAALRAAWAATGARDALAAR